MKKTDYKWIDTERENKTTDSPIYWVEGGCILMAIASVFLSLIILN